MNLQPGSRERAAEVLQTFCAEAAVLLLVFPLLDEFVQHGKEGISWSLVALSIGGATVFLLLALILATLVQREEH